MSVNIVVPEVGESIVDARVAKWLRKEGESVAAGDALVELETDKIDLEVAAPQAGVLQRIDRKDGEDVKVGEVLGVIEEGATGAEGAESCGGCGECGGCGGVRASADAAAASARKTRATPTARKAAEQTRSRSHESEGKRRRWPRHAPRCRGGSRLRQADGGQAGGPASPDGRSAAPPQSRRQQEHPRPPRTLRTLSRHSTPSGGRADRRTRADVEAPRDDCEAAGRGTAHRGDAHDLQRGRHVRRAGSFASGTSSRSRSATASTSG